MEPDAGALKKQEIIKVITIDKNMIMCQKCNDNEF